MPWCVFSAAVIGASHADVGLPCQDAHAHHALGDVLYAAVCDGAGSASMSHLGSRYVAETMVQLLAERGTAGDASFAMSALAARSWAEELLQKIRRQLETRAHDAAATLSDYAATLACAVVAPDGGWLFHIGDGVAVARPRSTALQPIISGPENGEYSNETFFITDNHWRAHLRVTRVEVPLRSLVLLSDGAAPFVMARGCATLFTPFMDPVDRFLNDVQPEAGSRALAATLADPRLRSITADDKTLVIARWDEPPESGRGTDAGRPTRAP